MDVNFENIANAYVTVGGIHKKVAKIFKTINGVWVLKYEGDPFVEILVDFEYTLNSDGTATITAWKGTLNGVSSTELVVPDDPRIIL